MLMLSTAAAETADWGGLHDKARLVYAEHGRGLPHALARDVRTWRLPVIGEALPVMAVAANAPTEDLSRRLGLPFCFLHQPAPTPTKAKRSVSLIAPMAMPSTFRPLTCSTSCLAVSASACSPFIPPMYAP